MIAIFPDDVQVVEGEEVAFRVKVIADPQPKISWYHNGMEVVADYSKMLERDGSLIIPSAELQHIGDYLLVAQNKAGSEEKRVKLFVHQEGKQSVHVAKKQIYFPLIPVGEFDDYVSKCHANDNENFRDQYSVRANVIICAGILHVSRKWYFLQEIKDSDCPTTIGSSRIFKKLNRYANITVCM